MKKIEDVITALEICWFHSYEDGCRGCPYWESGDCHDNAERKDALHYLRMFRDRIPRWISVKEQMPENDEIMAVRCVTKKGVVTWNRAWYDKESDVWHGSGSFADVTHWMPIRTELTNVQ